MTGKIITSLALTLLLSSVAFGQEVSAGLSSGQAQVGEPIQLMVTVRGARGADVPEKLSVNGLRINLAGRSTQFEMRNMKMTSTLTYTYLVVPQVEGDFTIPSFDVQIEGKTFRTQPMKLAVSGSSRMPQAPGLPQNAPMPGAPPQGSGETGEPFFADLIISKKRVFVGEVVPVELRFYFNSRIGGQVGEKPTFGGEGFTVQKFSNAVKREQIVNGENYVVFSFQTAITAVKSGALELPEATLEARLQVPGKAPAGFDSFFNNFPLPQGMFSETQDVTVKTKSQQLDVLPLPREGKPDDFTGAVGKFTMEASVSPKKTQAGEPFTLRAAVAGQGNFDAMGAPSLTQDEGWRTYPPSDKFQSTDSIGFTGEKTFEFAIIAREDQSGTPGLKFSYFDPAAEKYVTLTQAPLPVEAKAGSAPAPAAPANADQQPPPPAAKPTPASTPDVSAMAGGSTNWSSPLFRPQFLIANAALATAWVALLLFIGLRRFSQSASGRQRARRRRTKEEVARLKSADPATFYQQALKALLLILGTENDELATAARIDLLSVSPETKQSLHRIIERHDESKYASRSTPPPSLEEREQITDILHNLAGRS